MARIAATAFTILLFALTFANIDAYYGRRRYNGRRTFFRRPSYYNQFMRQTAMVYEKAKVETLGDIFKRHVQQLRQTSNRQVELVFLIDSSGTVGRHYFFEEVRFVRNLLADFTVDVNATRVSVITFSSPHKVFRHVDYLSEPAADNHKCRLLGEDVPKVSYTPGGTFTLGALLEAEFVLRHSRPQAAKAIFLMTDGYSNGGDPRPVAARLRRQGVKIFTFGIRDGFVWELQEMASDPKNETCYILDSFEEFEGLAKRALHADLHSGTYLQQTSSKCDQLCQDEYLCCHANASCACGTYTGKYECLCRPGHYGTGRGPTGCTPCPHGTYKNSTGFGDVSICTRCPDEHQTTPLGAVSEQQCVCKRGYRRFESNDSNECTVFRCPKLSPPIHGYFVNKKCNNVFNAACGLKCEHGYELRGSSLRICQDDGTWSGSDATCIMKTCPSLPAPKNGHMVCSSDDFSYSTTCRFTCNPGYKLVNSRKRKCLAISEWTGIPPRCIGITCPPLVEIRDGTISPPSCTVQEVIFGSTCQITCAPGYTLEGPHTRQCSPEGVWLASEEGTNKCVDKQAPLLDCPEDMVVNADEFQDSTEVTWRIPVAVDNSGLRPVMTSVPAVTPGSRLPQGITTIWYRAEDLSHNVASCQFSVNVVDKTPPRIDSCVSPPRVVSAEDGVPVNFTSPEFSDNSGRDVEVAVSHSPGDIFYYGQTAVTYQAFDIWNNNVTCVIQVEVVPHMCVKPDPPVNGNVTCEEGDAGVTCHVTCLTGYAFLVPPAEKYICDYSTGTWSPAEQFPFPDCAVIQTSSDVMQPATITLVGDLNCQETQLLSQVKQRLEDKVENELANVCENDLSCSLGSLQVLCEDQEENVNISQSETNSTAAPPGRKRRSVRDAGEGDAGRSPNPSGKSRVSIQIMLEGQLISTNSSDSDISRRLRRVMQSLQQEARQGLLDLRVDGKQLDLAHVTFDPDLQMLRCPQGSVPVNDSCVNCPVGTYYNVSTAECLDCPRGSFQPQEGQESCVQCPAGRSTTSSHAKTELECKARCLPGSFSSSGLEPCESCVRGFYQPDSSATDCRRCPVGATTHRRGSRTPQDCAEPCPRGHVSETGLWPCFRCPHHSYQPDFGKTQCLLCPLGHVTEESGAVSVESCTRPTSNQSSQGNLLLNRMLSDEAVVNFDPCFSQPCRNGGTCTSEASSTLYNCTCPDGFAGSNCEQAINVCESNPCLGGGQCVQADGGAFSCVCANGFTGDLCQVDVDDCANSPCENQAECLDGVDSFRCVCPQGYSGRTCADLINHCTDQTCRNGGTCTNTPAGFQCACATGFFGTSCEVDKDECVSSPCENGATCKDMPGSYRCECVLGFAGNECQVDIDECESTPCQHGATCEDLVGNYRCQCKDGFSGDQCERELTAHYQLDFISPTIMDYAKMTFDTPLSALSISVWFRTSDDQNQGTIFSYSVPGQPDTFTLTDYANLNLIINGQVARIGARLNDNRWHHFVFTWSSDLGDWKAYSDGIIMDQNTDLSRGKPIPGQGVFIVGQEQDSFGGNLSPAETFVGSLTQLNIWNYVLTLEEVEQLRFGCDHSSGNVIAWPSVQANLHGNVASQPTSFCQECPRPADPKSGTASFTATTPGSVVTFTCASGHDITGKQELRCMASAQWEDQDPLCIPITCGNPGKIANGYTLGKDYSFGQQVRYSCKPGYELVGEAAVLKCEEWGDWDYEKPECQEIQCDLPALSANTVANSTEMRIKNGVTVSFSCLPGSIMQTAHNQVTCQRDGTWDKSVPSCDPLHCGIPPVIANGKPRSSNLQYNVGDTVRYTCNRGFEFDIGATNNKKNVVCLPSGQWDTELPSCQPIKCLDPPRVRNARAIGDGRTVDSPVTYVCEEGFRPALAGNSTIRCQLNHQWTKIPLRCIPVTCEDPQPLANGSLSPPDGPYRYGLLLIASCNLGYNLVPSDSERACLANGTWSGVTPSCKPVSCGAPPGVAMGTLTLSRGTSYLDTAKVTCDPGHVLNGPETLTCEASMTWKPEDFIQCSPRPCPVPADVDHGFYQLSGPAVYGSRCEYSCATGYRLEGTSTLTCTQDGQWSEQAPTCVQIACPALNPPPKGSLEVSSFLFSGQALYTCDQDYRLEGVTGRTCKADGTWSDQAPNCVPTKCNPPGLSHGTLDYKNLSPGSIIRHICDEGYTLKGPFIRRCQLDLTLSGAAAVCEAVECGIIGPPVHGEVLGTSMDAVYQDKVSFKCNSGYYLSGDESLSCGPDGEWLGKQPECLPVQCPDISGGLANGRSNSSKNTYTESVSFACDLGYSLQGASVLTCQADATWDHQKPVCQIIQCPELNLDNGFLNTTERTFGTVVELACHRPHRLKGPHKRTCTAIGDWSGDISQCLNITCPLSRVIDNGAYTSIDEITVEYACNEGYILLGNSTQVCGLDGEWTPDAPVCKIVECGAPNNIENGNIVGKNYTYGSELHVICDFGYHLAGNATLVCQEDGEWLEPFPTCEKTTCPIHTLENGQVIVTSYEVLGQAQYQCNLGYHFSVDPSIRECLESGEWSGDSPVCERIICLRPENLSDTILWADGSISSNKQTFYFGEEVSYMCRAGFFLSGPDVRVCGIDGRWSGMDSQCLRVSCPEPVLLDSGWLNGTEYTFESVLQYGCQEGYDLLGESSPECLENGTWSDQSQICVKISCGEPASIDNTVFVQRIENFLYGAKGTYSCVEGYTESGNSTIECMANKQWSNTSLACSIVSCPAFSASDIPFSSTNPDPPSTTYGSSVSVHCSSGYILNGSTTLTCLADGAWSQPLPNCNIVTCPPLPTLQNGKVNVLSSEYGGTATFSCDIGYEIQGSNATSCLDLGSWDAAPPECIIVSCLKPPDSILHGHALVPRENYFYGESIIYKCNTGYELKGSKELTCQANGSFDFDPPVCEKILCPAPEIIEHGNVTVERRRKPSSEYIDFLSYTCESGYELLGNSSQECLLGGIWSGATPVCNPVLCSQLSAPSNGSVLYGGMSYGDSANFTCDPGYDLIGSKLRVCQANQSWSGEKTQCEPKFCGPPVEPFENGRLDGEYFFTSGVVYSCLPGFELQGQSYRSCQSNGTWAEEVPFCKRLSCQSPPSIRHGSVSGPPYDFESQITYSCNDGYQLQGGAVRVCQASLTWSGQLPDCNRISCGPPPAPENGEISGMSYLFEDIVNISCHHGYRLNGTEYRVCQDDGRWSFEHPLCEQVFCGIPPSYEQSFTNDTETTEQHLVGTLISYQCEVGYVMDTSGVKVCQQSGEWSGDAIVCYPVSCENVTTLENGVIVSQNSTYLSIMGFACNDGFQLVGETFATCTEHGNWSSSVPSCQPIQCTPLAIENGYYLIKNSDISTINAQIKNVSEGIFGDIATAHCNEGFELVGPRNNSCTKNGNWSLPESTCLAITCPIPTSIGNAHFSATDSGVVSYGSILSVSCLAGFVLIGNSDLTCGSDGNWEEPLPSCVLSACGAPPPVPNAFTDGDDFRFGASVFYRCKPGYELRGNSALVCGTNSIWQGSLPVCVLLDCGVLPSFFEATVTLSGRSTYYGSTASIICNAGFFSVVDPIIKCGTSGMWEYDPTFECQPVDCGEPPAIPHGFVDVDDTTLGSAALYSCSIGYYMTRSSSMYCEEDGTWVYDLPECKAVECPPPPDIQYGISHTPQGTQYQAVATYQCETGYDLVNGNAHSLTCDSVGVWRADTFPSCQAVDCGLPPTIQNAAFLLENNSTDYLSQAFYECNDGYQIASSTDIVVSNNTKQVLTCTETKNWIGQSIKCVPVDCGEYPESPNAIYFFNNATTFGASISYSCSRGFYKSGPDPIVCEATGNWSNDGPACLPVDCGSPPATDHANVTFSATTFGSTATYLCEDGYSMVVNKTSTSHCLDSGVWSLSQPPTCEPVDCLAPTGISHGFASFNATALNSHLTYKCDHGYVLTEHNVPTFKCHKSGLWKGDGGNTDLPECVPVNCSRPQAPADGYAIFSSETFGARAVFTCKAGYHLSNNGSSECNADGYWKPDPPLCLRVNCSTPPEADKHGSYMAAGSLFGDTAVYSCNIGYTLVLPSRNISTGSVILYCDEEGHWNGNPPKCKIITCENSVSIENGSYAYQNNTFGSEAHLQCNEGYNLTGSGRMLCSDSGTWVSDGEDSRCERFHCSEPPKISHAMAEFTSLSYGSEVEYVCDLGYTQSGSAKLMCGSSGWEGDLPVCNLITCNVPAEIPNGQSTYYSGQLLVVGEEVRYTCNLGFYLEGFDLLTCSRDGDWLPEPPTCKQVLCPGHPIPPNSLVLLSTGRSVNGSVTYTCETGYQMDNLDDDSTTITCGLDGSWSGQLPSCQLVTCKDSPPFIRHATSVTNGVSYSSKAVYTCNMGYIASGVSVLTCDHLGQWSALQSAGHQFSPRPNCIPVDCGSPPSFPHANYSGDEFTLNQSVTYSCFNGYDLIGQDTISCLFTGSWSPASFRCQVRTCKSPSLLENGAIRSTQADPAQPPVVGDEAHVTCHEGFLLVGSDTLRCMENGLWNTSWPQCQEAKELCVEKVGLQHSAPVTTRKHAGDQIVVQCVQGYTPRGNMLSACLPDQSWSLPRGSCERVFCGRPTPKRGSETTAMLLGWNYYYKDTILYVCRYGFLSAHNPAVLTCSHSGVWDRQPECIAQCRRPCLNGGQCLGQDICKCLPGWAGRRCETANCIMPCLNGGTCVRPYHCACPAGYKGPRCEQAVCSKPCQNDGRCIQPNRCRCPFGFTGAFCENVRIAKWRYNSWYF